MGWTIARRGRYHVHVRDGRAVFVHRHEGDGGQHLHHAFVSEAGRGSTQSTDGRRTSGEATPIEDAVVGQLLN